MDPSHHTKAVRALEQAVEQGDASGAEACFSEDCQIELLGVRLSGRDGVRRWLAWLRGHAETLRFEAGPTCEAGATLARERVLVATLADGRTIRSHQVHVSTFAAGGLVALRMYFNPLDFAAAEGRMAEFAEPLLSGLVRRGLEPYTLLDPDTF